MSRLSPEEEVELTRLAENIQLFREKRGGEKLEEKIPDIMAMAQKEISYATYTRKKVRKSIFRMVVGLIAGVFTTVFFIFLVYLLFSSL